MKFKEVQNVAVQLEEKGMVFRTKIGPGGVLRIPRLGPIVVKIQLFIVLKKSRAGELDEAFLFLSY